MNFITIHCQDGGGDFSHVHGVTSSQRAALAAIWQAVPRYDFYGRPEDYEIKEFTVSIPEANPAIVALCGDKPRTIYLDITTGRKNDAGTMAAVFGRKHRLLSIGPRGGLASASIKPGRSGFRRCSFFEAMNTQYWT